MSDNLPVIDHTTNWADYIGQKVRYLDDGKIFVVHSANQLGSVQPADTWVIKNLSVPDEHPWLENVQKMTAMLRGEIKIPHYENAAFGSSCQECLRALNLRREYLLLKES